MKTASATTIIDRPADDVWRAISDITRMGEWSPECIAGRWAGDAFGPAVGASFEGDNAIKVAGRTLKRWTTTSDVTACEPGRVFEFFSGGLSTWRYELTPTDDGRTSITESFQYEPKGVRGFIYETVLRRSKAMGKGMGRTLARLKAALEATP